MSFWYDDMAACPSRARPCKATRTADVCIIGAGYTGLWTAYYLKTMQPDLDVMVVEKDFAGFGASGRNGGWLTGGFAWNHRRYLATSAARMAVRAMVRR